jgi:bifunctional DNA-binding transcriptional regulator/antitoxin component of YhaV-PrlF toxin-antitoxin module
MGDIPEPTYEIPINGKIIATSTMRDRGRTQVPPIVKKELNITDGDTIFWIKANNKIYVIKEAKVSI